MLTIEQYNNKTIEKALGIFLLVGAILFNLWIYRLEPMATIDPNDNAFQFALVDRTNRIWDFAQQNCSEKYGAWNLVLGAFCQVSYLADHWVPNWAEGYNLPNYYSHVPQILIVGSYKLLTFLFSQFSIFNFQFSLFQYYHWVIYLLLSLFPLSVFLALRVIKLSWLAAGIGAILASHISTDGLYGLDPPSFLWRGYGLSSQLFAMIWLPLAIAYSFRYFAQSIKFQTPHHKHIPSTNGKNSKQFGSFGLKILNMFPTSRFEILDSSFWLAVLFLTLTAMGHLGLGVIAMLSLLPLAFGPIISTLVSSSHGSIVKNDGKSYQQYNNTTIQQLLRLAALAGTVIFFLSYWIIPIILGDNYHNISFWDPPWKFASYGAKETITRLFNGDLFDWGRGPWMTTFVMAGLLAGIWPKNQRGNTTIQQYNSVSFLFLFWLFMYFGRTTWGPVIDLIPGMKEFHLSRFIVGVHATGLFLVPIGVQFVVQQFSNVAIQQSNGIVTLLYGYIVTILIGIGIVWAVYPQTISYASHNDRLIRQSNERHAGVKSDEEALFALLRTLPPGRVFAGRGGWWGKDFRVAETPYFMHLSTYGIPTTLWLPETWSPTSDVEQYFSEDQARDYDLFGIRYVAAPPTQKPQPFWELIDERKTWKLYETTHNNTTIQQYNNVPASIGYFTSGVRPAVVSVTKRDYSNVVRLWIQSGSHERGLYPQLTFAKDYPRTTGLPNFRMLDEVTYQIPNGSTHNLFSQPPVYLPPGVQSVEQYNNTTIQQYNNVTIDTESAEADMIFRATVTAGDNCQECIVVLKQSFHPNWKATIDGKPATPFTVFPFYLAVPVPAGTHEIVFSYEPGKLKVTLLTMELLTLCVLFYRVLRNVRAGRFSRASHP